MRHENDGISVSGKTHHPFTSVVIVFGNGFEYLQAIRKQCPASFIRIKKAPLPERFFFYHFTWYQ